MRQVYSQEIDPAELPERVVIPSFTEADKTYEVKPQQRVCDCGSFRYAANALPTCKHLRLVLSGAPVDEAERGRLSDGTRVLVLAAVDHSSFHRTWGFDRGDWQHTLCFDGRRFIRESNRYSHNTPRFQQIILTDWREWTRHIPLHRNTRRTTKTKGAA